MSKPFYMHHYAKVVVPFSVEAGAIADYVRDDYAKDVISGLLDGVRFTVTVSEKDPDTEVGETFPTYEVDDFDIDYSMMDGHLVLFKDTITQATEDYIIDHEEDIICSDEVRRAFESFRAAIKK